MQKFHKNDLVRIVKDLGSHMGHFQSDCDAIVIGSYRDQFGHGSERSYTLYIKGSGEASWYEESQLTLLEKKQEDLLRKWQEDEETERELMGNIEWIFNNGESVLKKTHSSTIETLAECIGLTDLWGKYGEGFVYWQNSMLILVIAKPFLEKNDKEGWLKFCKEVNITK